jgi:hypothetical protein
MVRLVTFSMVLESISSSYSPLLCISQAKLMSNVSSMLTLTLFQILIYADSSLLSFMDRYKKPSSFSPSPLVVACTGKGRGEAFCGRA